MEKVWEDLYKAAKNVQNPREVSERIYAGGVAAAIEASSGKIYTGVCVDTSCTLGICAERNAIFNMITNGDNEIKRVLAIMSDGKTGAPCGACRELMTQLMPKSYQHVEIMLDYKGYTLSGMDRDSMPDFFIQKRGHLLSPRYTINSPQKS